MGKAVALGQDRANSQDCQRGRVYHADNGVLECFPDASQAYHDDQYARHLHPHARMPLVAFWQGQGSSLIDSRVGALASWQPLPALVRLNFLSGSDYDDNAKQVPQRVKREKLTFKSSSRVLHVPIETPRYRNQPMRE